MPHDEIFAERISVSSVLGLKQAARCRATLFGSPTSLKHRTVTEMWKT